MIAVVVVVDVLFEEFVENSGIEITDDEDDESLLLFCDDDDEGFACRLNSP